MVYNFNMDQCVKHGGSGEASRRCLECNREYQRKWYSKNKELQKERVSKRNKEVRDQKRRHVYSILLSSKCQCGESHPAALQFHHIKPENKVCSVAKMTQDSSYSLEKLKSEISKCELICANCHSKKTADELNWYHDLT